MIQASLGPSQAVLYANVVDSAHRSTLAWMLAPVSVDEFLNGYLERKPLFISRNVPGFYGRYFSLAELDRALHTSRLRPADLQMYRDGTPVRLDLYTLPASAKSAEDAATDLISSDRASALFASGCTMTVTSIDNFSASAAQLNRALEAFFRCGINPNVYLTPRGNQGFSVHYDTHDTLIVQIEGTKHWRVYAPTSDLPLDHQRYDRKVHKPESEPLLDIELRPGDLLYIPRGFCHEAKANEDISLHVTFGFFPPRWAQVVTKALQEAAENEVRLRKYASPGAAAAAIAELLPEILSQENLERTLEAIQTTFIGDRRNELTGQLQQIAALESLSGASLVAIRPNMLYQLAETPTGTKLTFSGKTVLLPKAAAALIHVLEHAKSATAGALEQHDDKALAIVTRLIQEGFAVQVFGEPATHEASVA